MNAYVLRVTKLIVHAYNAKIYGWQEFLQHFKKHIKAEATNVMRKSPRYTHLNAIGPSAPSKLEHYASITAKLPRRHCSLFQLRSGHAPLNKHLHRIAKSSTVTCQQCSAGRESVHHFLITCPAYIRQRNSPLARYKLGTQAHHVKYLLNDPKRLKALFQFIATTHRFKAVFGDVSPARNRMKKTRSD